MLHVGLHCASSLKVVWILVAACVCLTGFCFYPEGLELFSFLLLPTEDTPIGTTVTLPVASATMKDCHCKQVPCWWTMGMGRNNYCMCPPQGWSCRWHACPAPDSGCGRCTCPQMRSVMLRCYRPGSLGVSCVTWCRSQNTVLP